MATVVKAFAPSGLVLLDSERMFFRIIGSATLTGLDLDITNSKFLEGTPRWFYVGPDMAGGYTWYPTIYMSTSTNLKVDYIMTGYDPAYALATGTLYYGIMAQ